MQAVGKTVVEFDSLSRRLLLKLYIYIKGANRQQRYGPYRLQAGNSGSRSYSESEAVREYS